MIFRYFPGESLEVDMLSFQMFWRFALGDMQI
jgi:hypothetical protein